jgi:hypothetical protein
MAGSVEYLIENEVVPALHRIAVALERLDPKVVISEEELSWQSKHGEVMPSAKNTKKFVEGNK